MAVELSMAYRPLFVDAEVSIARAKREEREAEERRRDIDRLRGEQAMLANASASAYRERQLALADALRAIAADYESRIAAYSRVCAVYPKALNLDMYDLLRDL